MKLTRDEILKLAKLSRLTLSENEVEQYQKELSSIIEYVQQLDSAEVGDLLPTYQVTGLTSEDYNATRADIPVDQVKQKELFKNLPSLEKDLIKVKRMIG